MAQTAPKKAMTKTQVIAHLALEANITKAQAKAVLEELVALAIKQAKFGFTIPGLGKLVLVQRKARMGINPQTKEKIKIPAKKVVRFRVAKSCKDAIVPPKGC